MKSLFDIGQKNTGSQHTILLEVGPGYVSYAYLDNNSKSIDGLHYFLFDEEETEKNVAHIIAQIEGRAQQPAIVCSAFPQALLTPAKFFTDDYATLDAVYGQHGRAYFNDAIPEWQLVNVYSFPEGLKRILSDSFSAVSFYHAYTPAIKIYSGYVADNQLLVHFTQQQFRVLLKKDSTIHLAQTYSYKTPLDVVYHLLKICQEFGLPQASVHFIVSGLIEQSSQLYTELQQYFSNLHFTHPPEISFPANNHPHHFFTSLYNLAACAS